MSIPQLLDLCDRADFPCEDWENEFAPFLFFRLIGYREIADRNGLTEAVKIKQCCRDAVKNVPDAWKSKFPNGKWSEFAAPQIDTALDGDGMRFDKAALAIIALHQAIEKEGGSAAAVAELYRDIKIAPALFFVDGFTRSHVDSHGPELAKAVLGIDRRTVFQDMTGPDGRLPVTNRLAKATAGWLSGKLGGSFSVVRLATRAELPKGRRRIASNERVRLVLRAADDASATGGGR